MGCSVFFWKSYPLIGSNFSSLSNPSQTWGFGMIVSQMACGLFSSFDPTLLNSVVHVQWKWMTFLFIYCTLSWGVYHNHAGASFLWVLVSRVWWGSTKELFSYPKATFLIAVGLFVTILTENLLGLLPFSFPLSSHLSANLSIALPLWMSGVTFSLLMTPAGFFGHLLPVGSPAFLWPLLVIVESVSIIIRPLTLSIRLMANIMAGHLILGLMGEFLSVSAGSGVISTPLMGFFMTFEGIVGVVQAYVFVNLLSLYLKESEDH